MHSIGPTGNDYLDRYNSYRVDLVADLIDPPDTDLDIAVQVDYYPTGDLAYWIATHLLGLNDCELVQVGGVPLARLRQPNREILVFLRRIYGILQREIKPNHVVVGPWNHQRYLLIKYYLDFVYHVIG